MRHPQQRRCGVHEGGGKLVRRAAIVAARRTGVGGFGGSLRPVPVERLGAEVVKAVLQESGVDAGLVEDIVFAQSYASSETPCVGRWIGLEAGLPITVPGSSMTGSVAAGCRPSSLPA